MRKIFSLFFFFPYYFSGTKYSINIYSYIGSRKVNDFFFGFGWLLKEKTKREKRTKKKIKEEILIKFSFISY